jgi:toxin FitB
MYLLDTNVLSDARRHMPAVLDWIRSAGGHRQFVSVVTIGELWRGIAKLARKDPRGAAKIASWLASVRDEYKNDILPITEGVAREWGRLSARRGRPPGDSLIAATALFHDLTLVTRNVADFQDTGVRVVNPWTRFQ